MKDQKAGHKSAHRETDNLEKDAIQHEAEEESVTKATRLSSRLIYEVIRRDGEEELERPMPSLIWSGLAAGILISLSVLGEGILRQHLPQDMAGRYLIENFGYSFGFLVVIFGRMQLFTENTITTVLPVLARQSRKALSAMLRLWAVVLTANVVGALLAALMMSKTNMLSTELTEAVIALSDHAVTMGAGDSFIRAIPAGVLVAAIVWMMPSAEGNAFFVILTFTWLIAAGDFTHVIAGSVEMWIMLLAGTMTPAAAAFGYFFPVLLGNIIGGTAIFAILAWGQVYDEVRHGAGSGDGGQDG